MDEKRTKSVAASKRATTSKRARKPTKDALIIENQDYVATIAKSVLSEFGYSIEHIDDFISYGYEGLIQAAARYDDKVGTTFQQYAYLRIKGAIIDGIRKDSGLSRSTYQMVIAAQGALESRAELLHNSSHKNEEEQLSEVFEYVAQGAITSLLSLSDLNEEDIGISDELSIEEQYEKQTQKKLLLDIIATLPEEERITITEYYLKEKTFDEISEEQLGGVTRSWVSRIHARALTRLKVKLLESNFSDTHS
jgi:RNA polymerase sigma factor for flagellar operon FliA